MVGALLEVLLINRVGYIDKTSFELIFQQNRDVSLVDTVNWKVRCENAEYTQEMPRSTIMAGAQAQRQIIGNAVITSER